MVDIPAQKVSDKILCGRRTDLVRSEVTVECMMCKEQLKLVMAILNGR